MPSSKTDKEVKPLTPQEAEEALLRYTYEVEAKLKPDLDVATARRDKVLDELIQLEQMETALDLIDATAKEKKNEQHGNIQEKREKQPAMETRVNIGEEFYVRAHIYDMKNIIVDVGCDVLVEMSFKEAREFILIKRSWLEKQATFFSDKVVKIETHLKTAIKFLSELKTVSSSTNTLTGKALAPS